jgi:hypothetical protein
MTRPPYRVLALVPPREEFVGHWACSSASIAVERLPAVTDRLDERLEAAFDAFRPEAIAVLGKNGPAVHDWLDSFSARHRLARVPRVFRCQNTALDRRLPPRADLSLADLARFSGWFAAAVDARSDLVLLQTSTDLPIARRFLGDRVFPCPYGFDPRVFSPAPADVERDVDVGCYLSLKGDPRRIALVETASGICARHGWRFAFVTGRYGPAYAAEIRRTKVCLHVSEWQEVPFRLYETTASGSVFVTDPLQCGVEALYTAGQEYLTYASLGELEGVLESVLCEPARLEAIRLAGQARARRHTWPSVAEEYVVPALAHLLGS